MPFEITVIDVAIAAGIEGILTVLLGVSASSLARRRTMAATEPQGLWLWVTFALSLLFNLLLGLLLFEQPYFSRQESNNKS